MEATVDIDEIANVLVEVKDDLQTLGSNYPGLDVDPLFYGPLDSIIKILEEIE
jgi:hypothetical protein